MLSDFNCNDRKGPSVPNGVQREASPSATPSTRSLRESLESPTLSFLMEAHNGLSARIAEEAGFKGLWASGLTISASLGLRDSNEASWTQVLSAFEYIVDATSLPVLVDGDTGYGNFNNVRRLVRKLCQLNVAGVCIEDKLFPKTNSFIGDSQPLADIEEFCGKIRAAKDSQTTDEFVLVARVEALVSGHSMKEALRRAESYHAAGADAILIHSKRNTADEIFEFCRLWDERSPLVIVPTMYHGTPTEDYLSKGISMVIWANQLLRASVTSMQDTARQIHQSQTIHEIESKIAPVGEIFRLTDADELADAERRYLPESQSESRRR